LLLLSCRSPGLLVLGSLQQQCQSRVLVAEQRVLVRS
jgi:hypothetical protein